MKHNRQDQQAFEQRIETLTATPWLKAGIAYEPRETGVGCGTAGHGVSCLCDVPTGLSGPVDSNLEESVTHKLAWLHTNHGNRFRNGNEFVTYLETVALFHGAALDYGMTTNGRYVGIGKTRANQPPEDVTEIRAMLTRRILEEGKDWPWVRQWLTVNGFERERSWFLARLTRVFQQAKQNQDT